MSSTPQCSSYEDYKDQMTYEEYYRCIGQYDCPCVGSSYGCPAKTNGSQYCCKYYCPYEANHNVIVEEVKQERENIIQKKREKLLKQRRHSV